MTRFRLTFEPDFPPRMEYQRNLARIGADLDHLVVDREDIQPLIDWTLALLRQVYPGAEVLGPVTKKGGAVIFLGDTGEILIKPI